MAAVDLDTPFLACKHGAQVVKGEDCPEWEKLRMRNSIWRSLPLAMITLILSLRNLFEIPTCQIFALLGPIATSIVPELEKNDSRFIQDIRNVTNYSAIGVVRGILEASSRIPPEQKERFGLTGELLLKLEDDVWDAAHCSDSTWEATRMLQDQDASEHWALGRPVNLDRVEFGGIGSGNLASFNAIFFEQWVSEVERRGDEIKRHLKRESFWTTVGIKSLPWRTVLRNSIQSFDAWKGNAPRITVEQHRPWKLKIGDLVTVQIKFGWKVRVLQACGLLLVALLPILKKILAACELRQGQLFVKSIVGVYMFADLACVVMAWLLCATAPKAYHSGVVFKAATSAVGPLFIQVAQHVGKVSNEEIRQNLPAALVDVALAQNALPDLVTFLIEKFVPVLRWNKTFFLVLAGGSLVFVAASAVLAVVLCGAPWSAGVSAGVCGPLWLVSEDTKSRERHAGSIRGLYFMMVSRSLLLAGIVVLKWKAVDAFSVQIFFALIFNRILDITEATYWWTCWVAICAVHCLFGLAAAYVATENREESSEGATRSEELTAEEYFQATYGTFDPTVWTCKVGNLSETWIRQISSLGIRKTALTLSTLMMFRPIIHVGANMTHVCLLDTNHDTSWPLF